jgi:hypothetical protein
MRSPWSALRASDRSMHVQRWRQKNLKAAAHEHNVPTDTTGAAYHAALAEAVALTVVTTAALRVYEGSPLGAEGGLLRFLTGLWILPSRLLLSSGSLRPLMRRSMDSISLGVGLFRHFWKKFRRLGSV